MYSALSNKDLLFQISVNTDKKAFGELFKRYHEKLVSFALYYLPIQEEAEDVVSDVFVNLLKKHVQLKDVKNFDGYVYFSVKNLCLNRIKKNKHHTKFFTISSEMDHIGTSECSQPLNQLLNNELRDFYLALIETLPTKRKLVFKMIKEDNLKIAEVAKLLEITEKTVKKHLELAIKDLRLGIQGYLEINVKHEKVVEVKRKIEKALV
ncbi:RNA polymerase sigma-70 factor [Cyclobacterium sp. 1_MG-2023]|uniref:RNA polymerase sigma-70 factor n=1 Tax=Cyclobacterium sp. 1_MG-2023 TaxID=3062681 RepID=UPI0026E260EB|nr:RNA polymerase sigma-70 factor [Cyclobacterium sp. 1_MG-2023]MDO6436099.1 RNA polymerase sigma-70 factor [Cyclobacterium sp. 1_MG-2023]